MEEHKEYQDRDNSEIYSKRVKAGKRTYFFDVKSTRGNDFYLTITESKKRFKEEGYFYEKHKIFLYKEDFGKFLEALNEAVAHIQKDLMPDFDFAQFEDREESEGLKEAPSAESDILSDDSELKWD